MVLDNVIRKLKAIVGPDHIVTALKDRWTKAFDSTEEANLQDLVVFPESAAE